MEIFNFVFIHALILVIGVAAYTVIVQRLRKAEVDSYLLVALFFIFGIYGVLFMLLLSIMFWGWSGMASIGVTALVTISPIFMYSNALFLWKKRKTSIYHFRVYMASILYIPILITIGGLMYLVTSMGRNGNA
ncbi:MAG: hypothetical protein ACC707_15345 [Thiohalomonadales bacterium]